MALIDEISEKDFLNTQLRLSPLITMDLHKISIAGFSFGGMVAASIA
jgi:alpha/beta superfamily hydrolase